MRSLFTRAAAILRDLRMTAEEKARAEREDAEWERWWANEMDRLRALSAYETCDGWKRLWLEGRVFVARRVEA